MGITGNAIKLWEVATGRLVRQMESSIPSLGASSKSRPFRFSTDGKTLVAFADGRFQHWDVENGRELNNTLLKTAKDLFFAFLSEDTSSNGRTRRCRDAEKVRRLVAGLKRSVRA